ncbi:hypothetical protein ABEB36_005294 [Hypothenemus hampei]|uniref:Helicase POLQ-like n=1 Tax=Hypothenemus hampei TaxID=57062 RepID=A0ABD1F0R5_HYPHA
MASNSNNAIAGPSGKSFGSKFHNMINNPRNNFPKALRRDISKGSSSGLGSFEEDNFDSVIETSQDSFTIQNKKKIILSHERTSSPYHYKKKLKLESSISKYGESNKKSTSPLEDTLNSLDLDISAIIEENLPKKPAGRQQLDAFAKYLDTQSNNEGCLPHKEPDYDFSQSFNTQIINQLDEAIEESKSLIEDEGEGVPILKSFSHKLSVLKEKHENTNISKKLSLHTDNSVFHVCKRDVDLLFEQIEQSICEMGMESKSGTIPDEILDVIFTDDALKTNIEIDENKIQEELFKSLGNKTRNEDSFLSNLNCSLGTVMKQALLRNASKSTSSENDDMISSFNNSLNRTIPDQGPKFLELGGFFGLPNRVKDLIKHYKGIKELYDWQEECLNLAISNRSNLIYALPTSGGKTLVAEILMLREVLCYQKNVIFILPYVSIVQEKVWDFSPFGVALDFLVEEYASNKGSYPPKKRRRKRSVYIATIEKSLGLVNSLVENGRSSEIGLVVVDELHLIGEGHRGAILEACLTKIMHVNNDIQIVGMSATIGNIEEISKFLHADIYSKNFRPVELTEYVKCDNQIARINWQYSDENDFLTDAKKVDFKYSESVAKADPDMLGGLVLQVIPQDSCLVFCHSKNNCENVVLLLCKLTKPNLKEHRKDEKIKLMQALEEETGELCQILRASIPFGIAYHHSGLTSDERRLLEDAFRSGIISVICCTSTLAAGVNLPAKRVVLRSPYIGKDFISLSKYKQMVGRAGRTGLGEIGESIIISSNVDLPKLKALLMSPMNQALSNLHEDNGRGLRHLLLSCISLGIANTRIQLQKVSEMTLMAVQMDRLNVNIKKLTDNVIKQLFKMGALQESTDKVNERSIESQCNVTVKLDTSIANTSTVNLETPSKSKRTLVLKNNTKLIISSLGSAAIKGGLDLVRAHELYDDLYEAQKSLVLLNCLHLLYLVTPYDTSEQIKPNIQIYHEVLTKLDKHELQTARILGFKEAAIIKMTTGQISKTIPEKILNRFYVTLMLYDLWKEMPVFEVSNKYQINRGIVQNLMVNAATFASNVVNFCEELNDFWAFSHLLKGMSQRLSHCCIKELVPLMELPSVKQNRAKQLYNAGYKNLQSIAKANVNDLIENIEFMSRKTASQLIAASKVK